MGRRIVTTKPLAKEKKDKSSSYADKAASYIPGEVIAFWVAITGLIASAGQGDQTNLLWILFVVGLIATAFYTDKQTQEEGKPRAIAQIIITTFAFAVWVFGLGGPFKDLSWYIPLYGEVTLVTWTILIAPNLPIKQQ